MHPYDVLLKPVLSEKSNQLRESGNKYVFDVRLDATKSDVKKAVERIFDGVKFESVATSIKRGKLKRKAQSFAKTPSKDKRAIVSLTKDSKKIPLFEDL